MLTRLEGLGFMLWPLYINISSVVSIHLPVMSPGLRSFLFNRHMPIMVCIPDDIFFLRPSCNPIKFIHHEMSYRKESGTYTMTSAMLRRQCMPPCWIPSTPRTLSLRSQSSWEPSTNTCSQVQCCIACTSILSVCTVMLDRCASLRHPLDVPLLAAYLFYHQAAEHACSTINNVFLAIVAWLSLQAGVDATIGPCA